MYRFTAFRFVSPNFKKSAYSIFPRFVSSAPNSNVSTFNFQEAFNELKKEIDNGDHYMSYIKMKKKMASMSKEELQELEEVYKSGSFLGLLKGSGFEDDPDFKRELTRIETIVRNFQINLEKRNNPLLQEAKAIGSDLDFDYYYKKYPQFKYSIDVAKEKYELGLSAVKTRVPFHIEDIWNTYAKDVAKLKIDIKNMLEEHKDVFMNLTNEIQRTEKQLANLMEETIEEGLNEYPQYRKEIEEDVLQGRWDADELVGETSKPGSGHH